MSTDNPYRTWGEVASDAQPSERAQFIRQTYLHLAGAVMLFVALCAVFVNLPMTPDLVQMIGQSRWGWMLVLGAFMGVSYIANSWATSTTSVTTQYMGLGLFVVAESVIFTPILYIATLMGPDVIPQAGLLTVVVFAGLTAVVFVSGADFSFLRTGLAIAGFAALGIILCSIIFPGAIGELGLWFTAAMIVLASGYILYDTSNILHHYRIGQHVAAALALFASVALLFWWILRLVMSLQRR